MPSSYSHRFASVGSPSEWTCPAAVPDVLAPVRAFRDWRVTQAGLCSRGTGTVWTEATMHAECLPRTADDFVRPPHAAPGRDCHCGLHAYHEFSDDAAKIDFRGVTGIVTVWGRIEVHGVGMRAEFARVEALGVYVHWSRRQKAAVAEVARDLGVDLADLRELPQAASRYGSVLPLTLIPGGAAAPRARRFEVPLTAGERQVLVGA